MATTFPESATYCGWTKSCTTLKPRGTILAWYLQGNRLNQGFLRGAISGFRNHPQYHPLAGILVAVHDQRGAANSRQLTESVEGLRQLLEHLGVALEDHGPQHLHRGQLLDGHQPRVHDQPTKEHTVKVTCMYVCMHVCMYVRAYLRTYVYMYIKRAKEASQRLQRLNPSTLLTYIVVVQTPWKKEINNVCKKAISQNQVFPYKAMSLLGQPQLFSGSRVDKHRWTTRKQLRADHACTVPTLIRLGTNMKQHLLDKPHAHPKEELS